MHTNNSHRMTPVRKNFTVHVLLLQEVRHTFIQLKLHLSFNILTFHICIKKNLWDLIMI
ncbi:hypothetical protein E2C01_035867 [Portunus trituberculatus]|uniref:Uncharacterized protein n=1 Tax=Portunus trituberculatus TaxID=210409 RepID=A0A5B7F5H1_PORTR|nr:hypothetical protein [Portunus trituberculatus]